MNEYSRPHLKELTGLRFIAAMQVVLFHVAQPHFRDAPQWVRNVIGRGYVGVPLFFVLSGFILAYTYMGSERGLDRRRFWWARFARIYPVYVLGLIVAAPFFVWGFADQGYGPLTVLKMGIIGGSAISMTQAWIPQAFCSWNCPGWSVAVEAFFYLLFPLLAVVVVRLPSAWLAKAAAGLWLLSLLVPLGYLRLKSAGVFPDPYSEVIWANVVKHMPVLRLPEFLMGMIAGRLFLERGAQGGAPSWAGVVAVGMVAVVGGMLATSNVPHILIYNSLLAPAFTFLIYALAVGGGPVGWMLRLGPVVLLGEASYSLYILHAPLWQWTQELVAGRGSTSTIPALVTVCYLVLILAISILVLRFFETPSRRYLRRWFGVGRSPTRPASEHSEIRPAAVIPLPDRS